jgi:hypothetical protein
MPGTETTGSTKKKKGNRDFSSPGTTGGGGDPGGAAELRRSLIWTHFLVLVRNLENGEK